MIFWFLTFLLSLIVFLGLVFSAGLSKREPEQASTLDKTEEHFKSRLKKIDSEQKSGRLTSPDADDARAELARELMRHRAIMSDAPDSPTKGWVDIIVPGASAVAVVLAFGVYMLLGTPVPPSAQPAQQLAQIQADLEFQEAVERIELQTQTNPDDIRAWQVLSAAYVNSGRFSDAAIAYRRILELSTPTADGITDLAQALLMTNPAQVDPEAITLLKSAVELDPTHARSRFFLAVDATRLGDWDSAIEQWNSLLELATDDEPWVEAARESLGVAMARGEPAVQSPPTQQPVTATDTVIDAAQIDTIRTMVAGLDERLNRDGGNIDEWTQLVRSYLVLNDSDNALKTYEKAIVAYPNEEERMEMQQLVEQAGLLAANQ